MRAQDNTAPAARGPIPGRQAEDIALFQIRDVVTGHGSHWTACERMVAFAIASHIGCDRLYCWPSLRHLARWTGLHRATVGGRRG